MCTQYFQKMTKTQEIPKWFNGEIYDKGATVYNPFTGHPYELNNVELSIYDFIMGTQSLFEMGFQDKDILKDFEKALTWFRTNNAEAYMVLLD